MAGQSSKAGSGDIANGWVTQLRKGLVELMVLAALRLREAYGYELLQQLESAAGMELTESTLYPVLARLAAERFLAVRHAPSSSGPPRRYYRLTGLGEKRLYEMLNHWRRVNASIEAFAADDTGGA